MSLRYSEISQENLTRNRRRIKKIKARKANSHTQSATISWASAMSPHGATPERRGVRGHSGAPPALPAVRTRPHSTEMRAGMVSQGARWLKPWPRFYCYSARIRVFSPLQLAVLIQTPRRPGCTTQVSVSWEIRSTPYPPRAAGTAFTCQSAESPLVRLQRTRG